MPKNLAKSFMHLFVFSDGFKTLWRICSERHRQPYNGRGNCEWSFTVFYNFVNFGPQTPKMGPSYFPTLGKCCVLLLCQPLQRELTEQKSTTLCVMLGSEPDLQTRVKYRWVCSEKNWGAKNCLFCDGFQLDKTILRAENRIGVFTHLP